MGMNLTLNLSAMVQSDDLKSRRFNPLKSHEAGLGFTPGDSHAYP